MKIFKNIPALLSIARSVRTRKKQVYDITEANATGDIEAEKKAIIALTSSWGPDIMGRLGARFHIEGEENIPDEGPVVLVGNHQGYADILTYFVVFQKFPFGFIAKEELKSLPFFGKHISEIRSVFIHRGDPRGSLKAINEGVENIKLGFSMAIFPEGTRSNGKAPAPFMRGSLKLATKPGVPIVPVSLHGTYKMFERDGYIHGDDIYVKVHPAIPTADLTHQEEKALSDKVEKIVVDGVYELMKKAGDEIEIPEE